MKAIVALILAVSCVGGGFLFLRTQELDKEISVLRSDLDSAAAAARAAKDAAEAVQDDSSQSEKFTTIASRISRLEDDIERAAKSAGGVVEAAAGSVEGLDALRRQLAKNSDAIDAIRSSLARVGKTSSAIDEIAGQFLAGGRGRGESGGESEGRSGGLSEMLEAGKLMRKDKSELTPEELAKREKFENQFRQRQSDWTIRGFDRSLQTKLSDDQKSELTALLTEEGAALDRVREQDLDDEGRKAAQAQVKSDTDARAAQVLTDDQQNAWTDYRQKSNERRSRRFR